MNHTKKRRTKIVATIGPACDSVEKLKQMMDAGVDVFRFNMKHNTLEWHAERLERVEKICQEHGRRVGLMIDLQGPEIRIDHVPEKWQHVEKGDTIRFAAPGEDGIILDHPEVFEDITVGQTIYADDGFLEFKVITTGDRVADARVIEGGPVKERKTINFPGMHLNFSALIDKDLEHISLTARHHIDFVALSFVRNVDDIETLKKELEKHDVHCQIIAKIEHPDAVEDFNHIIDAADGIMIARGDLGVEYPLEEVPRLQKMIVRRCREEGVPVITATQMLETMIENPRPTRAEVSDVANAVYDSTDALMLSGETAVGKYPVKTVKTMARIALSAEQADSPPQLEINWHEGGQTAAVVSAAHKLMEFGYQGVCDLKAFVVLTETGTTVHYLSRLRPGLPIIALSNKEKTLDQLKLSWGVTPLKYDYSKNQQIDVKNIVDFVADQHLVEYGDKVVMIYGEIWGKPGLTSVIRVQEVAPGK